MDNQEKLNSAVKIAQSYILSYLKEYLGAEELTNIQNLFKSCPVVAKELNVYSNEFGKTTYIRGIAESDKIIIELSIVDKINLKNEFELNKLLGTIIHEYCHKIRSLKNQYGEMLEEAFASIFAEVCINNAKLKLNDKGEFKEPFEILNSINYQKYESQIRAMLYVLKQNGIDEELIVEYIAGNQEKFKQNCIKIFGEKFLNYFDSITSKNNENSEQLIIELITNYIKQKGLNISNYWNNNNQLSQDNLYFKGSPTLVKAVINSGIESFSPEEQKLYKYYEVSIKIDNENDRLIDQEKVNRIKQFIEKNFSLKGKTPEEMYDTIIDLCSAYIRHQNRNNEESKIFIAEIKNIIPNIESFKAKFTSLRLSGQDKNIFDNLDLDNITYKDIESNMNKLLQIEDYADNLGEIKR